MSGNVLAPSTGGDSVSQGARRREAERGDAEFLERFEAAGLAGADWDHGARLKAAYLYLQRFSEAEALERVEAGMRARDRAEAAGERGGITCHATATVAWVRLVAATLGQYGAEESAEAFLEAHPELREESVLRLFYSRERLYSAEAQARFLEPDLTALPRWPLDASAPRREVLHGPGGLRLRPVEAGDAEALFAAARESIAEVSPWMGWCDADYALEHARAWTAQQPLGWLRGTEYAFVIEEEGKEGIAGTCGLNNVSRENGVANIGYWVRTSRTRAGLASRAARLLAQFGIETLGLRRMEIVAATGNEASQRAAEKAGAKREGVLRQRSIVGKQAYDAVMFSLVAEDFCETRSGEGSCVSGQSAASADR